MKHYTKLFFAAAVAALGLASCAKEVAPVETPKDNLVTVHFGATAGIEGATKATLTTEDELTFTSAWENGDVLSVKYLSPANEEKIIPATWNMDSFEAALPDEKGEWYYQACYPKPDEKDNHIDFGGARTQNGNNYNSTYDVMICDLFSVEDAGAGKTADGNNVVFNMKRETAVAYFHLTDGPANEDLVSATLSVEGGFIASQHAYISDFAFAPTKDLKEITITFPEKAPKASDFQLWFNVLPTMYTKMTLTVETANQTLTISRTAEGMYETGKLYKVSKSIHADKWVKKGGETPTESSYKIEFNSTNKGVTTVAASTQASTFVVAGAEYLNEQPFSSITKAYYGGDENGSPLRLGTSSKSGSITMALSELGQYNATKIILSAKQFSTGKTLAIGVNGSAKQKPGEDYTDFEFALDGSPLTSIKLDSDGYIYVKSITVIGTPIFAPKYNVTVNSVEGGEIFSTLGKCEEGSEVVLTPKAQNGYEFGEWSVVATDGTVINVVDNKFTMPAQDVTVSCTFVKISYTITKAPAVNGSFTVKLGDTEVTTAQVKDRLTLTATPNDGYALSKWTVTYVDGETEKSFNPSANTFNMPAANVTVSATFVEVAHVPVYASVAELIAAGKPTTTRTKVTVTLTDEEITGLHKVGQYTSGVFLMVGMQEVEVYCKDTPADWKVGGTISGTLTNCDWMLYVNKSTQKETWELCPADYSELTYKAPLPTCATPVITIAEGGVVSITCATVGATIHYTVDRPDDPTEADAVFSAATLTDGQTIKAIAFAEGYKPSAVASKKYTAGGATSYFVKVTTAPTDWSGTYLIVYETGNVAFDGSLAKLDDAENTVAVTISENKIEATDALMKSVFTIDGTAIKSASGKYISGKTGSNSLIESTTKQDHTLSIDKNGNFSAVSNTSVLRYNSTSSIRNNKETGLRFRYYKATSYSSQNDIQLYKLAN